MRYVQFLFLLFKLFSIKIYNLTLNQRYAYSNSKSLISHLLFHSNQKFQTVAHRVMKSFVY